MSAPLAVTMVAVYIIGAGIVRAIAKRHTKDEFAITFASTLWPLLPMIWCLFMAERTTSRLLSRRDEKRLPRARVQRDGKP